MDYCIVDSFFIAPIREIIPLPDGGQVALDWSKQKCDDSGALQKKPLLLILPGITGTIYIRLYYCVKELCTNTSIVFVSLNTCV